MPWAEGSSGGLSCISAPLPRRFSPWFWLLLVSPHRCLLHCHLVVPVEGHCHHPGELPAPLRPQVPETEVFSPQLLEAHVLGLLLLAHRDRHCPGPQTPPAVPSEQSCPCLRAPWWSLVPAAVLRHFQTALDGIPTPQGTVWRVEALSSSSSWHFCSTQLGSNAWNCDGNGFLLHGSKSVEAATWPWDLHLTIWSEFFKCLRCPLHCVTFC